ncbi:hypothetical protein GQ44DRAFT_734490 [Phaeosphaeriaceae sp. PMI808]|nr:hypothetical protein GQ44DRAFT_734490 [Phaeosphaeriaceae sp. PMI808]
MVQKMNAFTGVECTNTNLSKVSVSAKNYQLCDLLLRKVKPYYTNNKLNVQIVRKQSWLEVRGKESRILQLFSNPACSADLNNDIQIGFPVLAETENLARFALLQA